MSDSVLDLVADLVGDSPTAGDSPTPGDRGDLGETPRRCWADSEATVGDFGRLLGDRPGDIAQSRPESPRVAPPRSRANQGKSPESPLSPARGDENAPEPIPPELVARLRKVSKRIVWAACQWYAADAADLVRFTDEELELLVGDYLLKRHVTRARARSKEGKQ